MKADTSPRAGVGRAGLGLLAFGMGGALAAADPATSAGGAGLGWGAGAVLMLAVVAAGLLGWRAGRRAGDRTAALQQALAAQHATEAFLRLIADNLPARISYWDRDNRCRFANRGFCEWHHVASADMIGRRLADLGPPWDNRARANQPRVEAVLAGQAQRFERDDFDPQGRPCVSLAHYVPDRRGDEVVGFVVLATDLSAEKATERHLRELNEQLATARDRAEAAVRAKSAFLANMSHEIRTPLNAIVGMSELLRRELPDADAQQRLGHVVDASRHLLALVNDVLDLSRIEAGKGAVEPTDFDPAALLRRAQALLADRAQDKGLTLALSAQGLPPRVHGDPARLTRVLLNLVGNAVKFTEQGGVTLSAWVQESTPDGWSMRFEVQDSGPGLTPEHQAQLFQPFDLGDPSSTRRHGGSGLGLAITSQLVTLMGGCIGVDSRPGEGARFWFELPLARPVDTVLSVRDDEVVAPETALRSRHAGRHVLLVEDNEVNQMVASQMLQHVGLTVHVACDGQQALDQAVRSPPDLILMDVHMPRMDGLQATRAWRRHEAQNAGVSVPVVALTATALDDERAACLAAGMDDHVSKPIEAAVLYATVLRWLDGARNGRAAASKASGASSGM